MSAFSRSVWISLTLNNALNYSQKFYTDKSDNNDFILHGAWTGPVGKIGNSGIYKIPKNKYKPDINSIKDSEEQLSEKVCF